MFDKEFMKRVYELLKESDRMDLWGYTFEKDIPEDPEDFVLQVIADHPEKPEKKINKIDEKKLKFII